MAKWWAITGPAKTPLTNGVGEAAFTVTNVTATAVRGLVRVLPEGSAKPEMFKIVGESTLDWAPNETKQVTVQINGQGAPPGSYVFTFAVVSEADPSELSDRLSSAFDVGAAASGKKLPVGIIVGIVAGVLVIGGVLWWLLRPDPVDDRLPEGGTPSPTAEETPTSTPPPTPTPVPEIPRGGCASYNPNNVVKLGVFGLWQVTDQAGLDYFFDQDSSAQIALEVMRSFTEHCSIGHVEYWLDPSGLGSIPAGGNCISYAPAAVERKGKVVTDGDNLSEHMTTTDDAERVLALAVNHSQRCTVQTSNQEEKSWFEYWM